MGHPEQSRAGGQSWVGRRSRWGKRDAMNEKAWECRREQLSLLHLSEEGRSAGSECCVIHMEPPVVSRTIDPYTTNLLPPTRSSPVNHLVIFILSLTLLPPLTQEPTALTVSLIPSVCQLLS
ncbi:Hypothetical predicted protein [Podarcis lilfordi]|uniref:Uncharacterized protein n=1 Tax=Podarcis lilfordi TaxID=74358 RepID=A0AA35KEJ5_9SAUR|nr:Hypothetical predicted protein [Podarcis lilfordi]